MADRLHASSKTDELQQFEALLDDSRLAKEDYFFRPPRTERETEWLRTNRTDDALHWNLLVRVAVARVPDGIVIPARALFRKAGRTVVYAVT